MELKMQKQTIGLVMIVLAIIAFIVLIVYITDLEFTLKLFGGTALLFIYFYITLRLLFTKH